jgi:hypothetical protein
MNDLFLHLIFGAAITAVMLLLLGKPIAGRRQDWLVIVSVAASFLVGAAKEAGDLWLGWGTPEVADLAMTWSGGMLALIVIGIIDWFTYKRSIRK